MPILHVQYTAQGQTPDGNPVQLPPAVALTLRGPCIQVSVTVSQSIAQQLLQQGASVPTPVTGTGLIDTGASATCIDDAAAQQLGLQVIDVAPIASASHAQTLQNVYPLQIEVVGFNFAINVDRAVGAPLAAQGLLVLIRRDVLQHCTLHYNGLSGEITLAM